MGDLEDIAVLAWLEACLREEQAAFQNQFEQMQARHQAIITKMSGTFTLEPRDAPPFSVVRGSPDMSGDEASAKSLGRMDATSKHPKIVGVGSPIKHDRTESQ